MRHQEICVFQVLHDQWYLLLTLCRVALNKYLLSGNFSSSTFLSNEKAVLVFKSKLNYCFFLKFIAIENVYHHITCINKHINQVCKYL